MPAMSAERLMYPELRTLRLMATPMIGRGKDTASRSSYLSTGSIARRKTTILPCPLGWTREGLLFLARVQDDIWHRKSRQNDPIAQDHVEIYLRKARRGEGSTAYHLTFNPSFGDLPLKTSYYGGLELGPGKTDRSVSPEVGITGGETWYVLEGLVPWQSVDFKPEPGAKPLFQLWVQDGDTLENEGTPEISSVFSPWKRDQLQRR